MQISPQRSPTTPSDRDSRRETGASSPRRTLVLPFYLKKALDNGVTRAGLIELVTHLAFYRSRVPPLDSHGKIGERSITAAEVARTFKRIAKDIELDPTRPLSRISAHSTRRWLEVARNRETDKA